MYRLRNYLFCAFIGIILVFAFAASEVSVFVKVTAADPQTYKSLISSRNIAGDAYRVISGKFESSENATGIPASVYMDGLSEDNIRNIMNGCISGAFDYIYGNTESFDYASCENELSAMKKSIEDFFSDYADKEGIKKDDSYLKKVDQVYENARDTIIENSDVFQFEKIRKAGYLKYARSAVKYINPAMFASLALTGLLVFLLVLANIGRITNIFYWLSVVSGITSLFFLAAGIALRVSGYFDRFAVKASHIFSAMTGTMYSFTDRLIAVNAVVFALGLIFMMLYAFTGKEDNTAVSEN